MDDHRLDPFAGSDAIAFADALDPFDGDRRFWAMPILIYLEHSLLNDGSRSAKGRLDDYLAPELLASLWRSSAAQGSHFDALCPWMDLRESEWLRLAELVGDATEGAAIAGWQAMANVYRDALIAFQSEFPNARRRDLGDEDPA